MASSRISLSTYSSPLNSSDDGIAPKKKNNNKIIPYVQYSYIRKVFCAWTTIEKKGSVEQWSSAQMVLR